ncbi:ribosome biogenesis factor YjgA [Desulfobacter postgatei]|mgnify:CR=1 FL=1|uniref:ribosome biogenesis factor YjgA n=1 Tax=Desulfobacter postgatei TaxID=2293 RepID=UPI00259B1955|nr:ribosome biogenesis factor YjgA [uncultured Desulfobacter sp.]
MTLPPDNTPDTPLPLSKTKKKKMAENLQKLGEDLSLLSVSQLELLDLDPELFKALVEAKSITANVAARRHRQYIGTLMRQVDQEAILEALERLKSAPTGIYSPKPEIDPQADKNIQGVLDRLLAWDDDAMETILSVAPDIDRQQLRQLIRNANKDISSQKKNSKSFQTLQEIVARI